MLCFICNYSVVYQLIEHANYTIILIIGKYFFIDILNLTSNKCTRPITYILCIKII